MPSAIPWGCSAGDSPHKWGIICETIGVTGWSVETYVTGLQPSYRFAQSIKRSLIVRSLTAKIDLWHRAPSRGPVSHKPEGFVMKMPLQYRVSGPFQRKGPIKMPGLKPGYA